MSAPRKPAIRGEALHRLMTILVVAPAFLAFGYSLSLWGAVVSYPSVYRAFAELNTTTTTGELKSHNALVQGAIVAAVTLGGVLGCLSCTVIGNHLGRRKTTFLGAFLTLVGTILLCTSFGTAQLCVSRGSSQHCLRRKISDDMGSHHRYGHRSNECDHPSVASRDQPSTQTRGARHSRRYLRRWRYRRGLVDHVWIFALPDRNVILVEDPRVSVGLALLPSSQRANICTLG